MIVKCIYYFICKTHKPIDVMNMLLKIFVQKFYGRRKRCAVLLCCDLTALLAHLIKKMHHEKIFILQAMEILLLPALLIY